MPQVQAMALSAALALGTSRAAAQGETRWIDTASVTPLGDDVYRVWERSVSRTSSAVLVLARAEFDCRLRLTPVGWRRAVAQQCHLHAR